MNQLQKAMVLEVLVIFPPFAEVKNVAKSDYSQTWQRLILEQAT